MQRKLKAEARHSSIGSYLKITFMRSNRFSSQRRKTDELNDKGSDVDNEAIS